MYYSASSFGSNRSAIGLATAPSLSPDAPWTDCGKVIETREGDDWNAIDAAFLATSAGDTWLAAGSFWSGLKLARLDPRTGLLADEHLIPLAARPHGGAIEAPFLYERDQHFYCFVSFDFCCRGAKSTYNVRVGRSDRIEGPYVDADGRPMLTGGGTLLLSSYDNVRGPGHCQVFRDSHPDGDRDYLVHHYYDAAKNGSPHLHVRPLTWPNGWPVAGDPLA